MDAKFKKHAAFTFIELIIVIVIMAILSVAMALAYQRIQLKVRYDANVSTITEFFQRARSLSLSTLMIDGTDPTYYYQLTVDEGYVTLDAYGSETSITVELDSYEYDSDMNISSGAIEVYYFPPSGRVCLGGSSCTGGTEQTVIFEDVTGTYSTQFTITTAGGYVEVEQLAP